MDSENESKVKELQATLFPPTPKMKTSFFSNFLIKSTAIIELDTADLENEDGVNKLKETGSRELFAFNRESNFVPQPPRWPTECQVLEERIKHISYAPASPEPYYVPTGKEAQPKPTGDECGIIVYQYTPISAVNYFSRSSVGGSKYLLPCCLCPEEDTLRFESRFECGNLERAIRLTPNFYELYLRADMYTNRHMQWLYFKVYRTKKHFMYRFSIVNFSKEDSLFNEGLKPLMYSVKDSQLHQIGWRRCGDNITYYCNDNVTADDPEVQMTYTLSFTMEFPHDDDEVYIASCYPYSYSDLEDYLTELSNHPVKSTFTTVRLLCKSLAGNNVHYVTVTTPPIPGDQKKKQAVVLSARVHPGETPASWMMKGVLDFITSDCSTAKELRDKFIFKLVPMLNPDGVIVGNNRCSLSAKDLNRQYRTVMREAYPSIWYTKLMVRRLLEECGVALYCDFHAHSRKHNIFIYGCENRNRGAERKLQEQVFPLMLHKNTADKFSFESCKFRIQKAKEGTGRVVMWMMGIANSYTLEASFAGSMLGARCQTHFSTADYEQMGKSFCQTLLDYYDADPKKEKLRVKIIDRLVKEGSNADEPTNIQLSDYTSDDGDTSSTSSNEVGRDIDIEDIFYPSVPPPSPIIYKKFKPKMHHAKAKMLLNKSPNVARKPLPICKTTVDLFLTESAHNSSTESEDEQTHLLLRPKIVRKKHKKKKRPNVKKKTLHYSDCEVNYKENPLRTVSVFDLVPNEKLLRPQTATKRSKTPQTIRGDSHRKHQNAVTHQLAQVQAKLLSLKNKLWFGMEGDNEENVPLSWGRSNFTPPPPRNKRHKRKTSKSLQVRNEKHSKEKEVIKAKEIPHQKKISYHHGGLKRQTAVGGWDNKGDKMRKSKSLPEKKSIDNASILINNNKSRINATIICSDEENKAAVEMKTKSKTNKKANKPSKTKFGKKAKSISHAKFFFHKD